MFQQEITIFQEKYKLLCLATNKQQKNCLITELRNIGERIQALQLNSANPRSTARAYRQMQEILQTCNKIQTEINRVSDKLSSEQMEAVIDRAFHTLAAKSLEMQRVDPSPEAVAEIAKRMKAVAQINEDMRDIAEQSGGNLQQMERHLDQVFVNVEDAGENVEQAMRRRRRRRRLKASIMGVMAGVSYFMLGLPGVVAGLFLSWKIF